MVLEKITEKVFAETSGNNGGNMGAIILDDQVIIVDAGMSHTLSSKTRKEIESITDLPMTQLVLTHNHSDHLFGIQAFEPIDVISSKATSDIIAKLLKESWTSKELMEYADEVKNEHPELAKSLRSLKIHPPDTVFEKEMRLGNKNELVVEKLGGHTIGSSILTFEDEGTLFAGDLIFADMFPYAGDPTNNPDEWITALKHIQGSGCKYIIPGHGPVYNRLSVETYIRFLEDLVEMVKNAIEKGLDADTLIKGGIPKPRFTDKYDRFGIISIRRFFDFYGV